MKANGKVRATLALALVTLAASTVSAAMSDEEKCLYGRAKAKAKYEQCVEKWLAKGYGGGGFDQAKLAKCRIKYAAAWTELQGLTGSQTCGGVARYADNGDGTVTDNLTGLVWEKKTTAVGSGTNFADPHDVDNAYSWNSTGLPPYAENGTAYTEFLANLNAGGFAGANGWRLPTFAELQTILLPEAFPCTTSPCIDPIFGPTQSSPYWSATTYAGNPFVAWYVVFNVGEWGGLFKNVNYYVRAVRGGF